MRKKSRFLFLFFAITLKWVVVTAQYVQKSYSMIGFPEEKVYLHSDKDFYLAGELLWFKIYCIDPSTQKASVLSKLAYVEILNRNGEAVLQGKIELKHGGGQGSFYLPISLKSDHYILRAYTGWMKNQGGVAFFEKKITIVNTMRVDGVGASSVDEKSSREWRVDFFPESGELLENIESKVAFRVVDEKGRGISSKGILIDDAADTVLQFKTIRFGIGQFTFKPLPGKKYSVLITDSVGRTGTSALPQVHQVGYVINVSETNTKDQFIVRMGVRLSGTSTILKPVTFSIYKNGEAKFSRILKSDETFTINKENIGKGVSHFVLIDESGAMLCERLVFVHSNSLAATKIAVSKPLFKANEDVELQVIAEGPGVDTFYSSISVYKEELWYNSSSSTMADYLAFHSNWLGDVGGSIGADLSGEISMELADNLMLIAGKRKAASKEEEKEKKIILPEYNGHFILGRVVNTVTGNSVAGADCFLTVPSSPYGLYSAISDSMGIVRFEVKDYYGAGEIIAQPNVENAALYRVDILNPFSEEKPTGSLPPFELSDMYKDALQEQSIAMQSQNIYYTDSIQRFSLPLLSDTLPFFGKSEYNYDLDSYKRFTTMEEVLREYVTPVNVTLRRGELFMSIYNNTLKEMSRDRILVLLDGVPINKYNKIFSYDPLKVKRLRVVPAEFMLNKKIFSGIVSFETYQNRFDGFNLDSSLVAMSYEGLQLQRDFFFPKKEDVEGNRIPDMRTTLFWNPDLELHTNKQTEIRFPASEQKGKFVAVLQGLSKKGEPIFATTTFTVE